MTRRLRQLATFLRTVVWPGRGYHLLPVASSDEALTNAYLAVFGSQHGKLVLDDLVLRTCFSVPSVPAERVMGQQDIVRYILEKMQAAYFREQRSMMHGRNNGSHRDHLHVGGNPSDRGS